MILRTVYLADVLFLLPASPGFAQERVKIACSSAAASNAVWFTPLDAGLYRSGCIDRVYR